jgi:hypothetical protein
VGERKFMVRALKFVPGKTLFEISPWSVVMDKLAAVF